MSTQNTALRIGFVSIARSTFDTALAGEVTARVRRQLEGAGCQLSGPAALVMDMNSMKEAIAALQGETVDLLLAFQASFADSTMLVELARGIDAPLLLWAVPDEPTGGRLRLNSLCGINLGAHGLTRAGLGYDWVYSQPDDASALKKALTVARAGRVRRLLRTARIGRIGDHPAGFDPCAYDGDALAARFGTQVVRKELNGVFQGVRTARPVEIEPVLAALKDRVAGLDALDQPALRGTLAAYATLRRLAQEENLHGLAVRCWPEFFTELGCAACGALSLLIDGMMPCSCEADVNGTITQLILQWLSGEPAFGTDIVGFDVAHDHAVVWHCGQAPLAMADPQFQPHGTIHSNRKLPLLMEFPLKPGRVTIARLTEAKGGYTLVIGAGEMLAAPMSFSGTSGVLRFDRRASDVLATILDEGLDHHISLTYGDHVGELLALAKMLSLPVLRLA